MAKTAPAKATSAYTYVDHKFDVVVVGAGGAGLRATLAVVGHAEARADERPRAVIVGPNEVHTVLVPRPVAARLRAGVEGREARGDRQHPQRSRTDPRRGTPFCSAR